MKKNKQITYHPLCFNCGRESKEGNELKPFSDTWGNVFHICRQCEIDAATARAIRLEEARRAKDKERK